MPEESINKRESLIDLADEERVLEVLFKLPVERWVRITDNFSYFSAALYPYHVYISSRPTETRESIVEISFYFIDDPKNKPKRRVFSNEKASALYEKLMQMDKEKEIKHARTLEEAITLTI